MKAAKTWTPSKLQGLYRHISGTYYARVSIAGKQTWRTLKTKVFEIAKSEFEKLKDEVGHKNELAKEITLDEHMTGGGAIALRELQIKNAPGMKAGTRKYWGEIITSFKRSWPEFSGLEIRKITEEQCLEWAGKIRTLDVKRHGVAKNSKKPVEKKQRGLSPTRFNNSLSLLKCLFEIAIDKGARRTNPAAKLKRLKLRQKNLSGILPSRAQFLEWISKIRNAGGRFSTDCADFVEFISYTGLRLEEAGCVRWQHCNFDKDVITVLGTEEDATKNGEIRVIPMIPSAKDLLVRMRAERADESSQTPVLKVKEAQKAMDRAAKEVGTPRLTTHELRHLFATVCIESNVPIPSLASWLGHKDGGVLAMKTYGHLRKDHSHASAKKVTFAAS